MRLETLACKILREKKTAQMISELASSNLQLADYRDAHLLNDRIDNAWLHEFRKLTEGF